jgi:hypothetical protein
MRVPSQVEALSHALQPATDKHVQEACLAFRQASGIVRSTATVTASGEKPKLTL